MQTQSARLGRATRLLLVAAALPAWAYSATSTVQVRMPGHSPAAPVAKVIVPGSEDVLALQEAADSAQAGVDARNPHNLVFTADHSVFTPVGIYADCTGETPLTHTAAAIDTCVFGLHYFIGHNPGVFSGLMSARVGSLIGYYDASGRLHRYEVVADRTWMRNDGVPPPVEAGEVAQFQTCVTADGSVDRILDAVEL